MGMRYKSLEWWNAIQHNTINEQVVMRVVVIFLVCAISSDFITSMVYKCGSKYLPVGVVLSYLQQIRVKDVHFY